MSRDNGRGAGRGQGPAGHWGQGEKQPGIPARVNRSTGLSSRVSPNLLRFSMVRSPADTMGHCSRVWRGAVGEGLEGGGGCMHGLALISKEIPCKHPR